MPILICPHDKAENPIEAFVCIQCGRKLSRVEVGGVFQQRYHILECLDENKIGFRYRVKLSSTGKPGILREIIPKDALSRERMISFNRVALHLIESHPRCLVPVYEHFMHQYCCYTLEGIPPAPTLRDTITKKGALPEQRAKSLLKDLLIGLKELYSLNPPVYVASLDARKILLNGTSTPVFLESSYISNVVFETTPPSVGELLRQDLSGAAYSITEALLAKSSPDSQVIAGVLNQLKDLTFAGMLEWILNSASASPDLLQKLDHLRGLLDSARSEMEAGHVRKSAELFNAAHLLSPSPLIKAALDEADAAVRKQVEISPPPPPPPPPGKEVRVLKNSKQLGSKQPPVPATPITWTCSGCKQTNHDNGLFCSRCRRPKVPPVENIAPSPPPKLHSRAKIAILTSLALTILIAGVGTCWYWYTALMRNFDAALAKNWLVSPSGVSAYDYYKKALDSGGPASSRVQEMNAQASPRLHRLTDEQFAQWYQTSRLNGVSWADLATAEAWLTQIDSNDVTSQARKEYADAQVDFLHNHFSEALTGFQRALQRAQNWDLALLGIGKSCFELRRYSCAEEYYQRAEQLEPGWIWPHRNLMELYRSPERRNLVGSCTEYRQLMDLSVSMSPAPFNREAAQKRMEPLCQNVVKAPEAVQLP